MTFEPFRSASDMARAIRRGETTSTDLLEAHLERFQTINPDLNAIVRTDVERARRRARQLDEMSADGEWSGPLHGVPLTIKDTFDVFGMPAVSGAQIYAKRSAETPDSSAVKSLRDAGAVIWGKTNTPYLAGDNQTFNDIHGVTNNPFDVSRTPGGSSGGSAAALASGMTPLELGSDIAGSLRLPAHFCGVCALKPSYGRVSQTGHVPPAPGSVAQRDLNVVGPMARTVEDLQLMFSVLTQTDMHEEGEGLLDRSRIAIWAEEEGFFLSNACASGLDRAIHAADQGGAHISKAKPDIDGLELLDVYFQLLVSVLSEDLPNSTLAFMEAMRPVYRMMVGRRPFSRAKWFTYATSRYRDWAVAHEKREQMKLKVEAFFRNWDAILAPVCAVNAFSHYTSGGVTSRKMYVDGEALPYHSFLSWFSLASACHLPSVVIPTGLSEEGLPVGVQVIGAFGSDEKILAIARSLEKRLGGFVPPAQFKA